VNTNKVALITGGNKGLGFEIAKQLGKHGITVVVGARDTARGNDAVAMLKNEGVDAHAVKLEVTNADDVAALPGFFEEQFGRLDILVNNAGVFVDREGASAQAFRDTYETNVIAPFILIETLLPLIKASPAGRIVNHSSALGSLSTNASGNLPLDWQAPMYNSSKAALNMLTVIHANRLAGTNVKVNAAHPGSVLTDLNSQGQLTVEEGAKTAITLATLPDDGPTGGFFHAGAVLPW
jgi:NAD(P)-dependent dehydrogenase (short-subunit alcohol dehydrogenase family)